jgi:hypothetical protein
MQKGEALALPFALPRINAFGVDVELSAGGPGGI